MRTFTALALLPWLLPATAATVQPDPVYRETEVRQSRPRLDGEVFDSGESDPELKDEFARADQKAERAVAHVTRDSGFIVRFWKEKQRILKKQFEISWKTPGELNPHIVYDRYGQARISAAEDRILRELVRSRFVNPSETVTTVDRSFEGVASVWTHEPRTQQNREYQFSGHDESWEFIKATDWER